jgi:hypothetical protein
MGHADLAIADGWTRCAARANHSWHWVVIPVRGISMGESFYLKELAADCAGDGVCEFFFTAPPFHLPCGTGSPINPQAIK